MSVADNTQPVTAIDAPVESAGRSRPVEADEQLLRLQRIGKRLFGVANCFILLSDAVLSAQQTEPEFPKTLLEQSFCAVMPMPEKLVVVSDTRNHPLIKGHKLVIGAPHIQFYASCPIYNEERSVVGSVNLVDYLTHVFGEEEQNLLADLARLVERELQVRSMSMSHLALQKKNKNLRRKSLIDPLIGTWNRGAIMRILAIEATRCDKLGVPLSLMVVDLDYFKKINDTYGHPAGDTVLVKIASRMRSCIRPLEALGRYGGEEFLVVLPGSTQKVAMAVAERMRETIAGHAENIGQITINLTISVGVASTEIFPNATIEELISHADIALYRAKDAGRNRVKSAQP